MKKHITEIELLIVKNVALKYGFEEGRRQAERYDFTPKSIISSKDVMLALDVALALYNPADLGMYGKNKEASERALQKLENGVKWFYWEEVWARKTGRADIGRRTEMKSGAGDWLYSLRADTWDGIIKEYRHKQTMILWDTEFFRILATWEQLLDYLESYNSKGLATWFKSCVKYNPMTSRACVMMQEFKTSKKKIAFLQACPYAE